VPPAVLRRTSLECLAKMFGRGFRFRITLAPKGPSLSHQEDVRLQWLAHHLRAQALTCRCIWLHHTSLAAGKRPKDHPHCADTMATFITLDDGRPRSLSTLRHRCEASTTTTTPTSRQLRLRLRLRYLLVPSSASLSPI
jgi:hypothetical protein